MLALTFADKRSKAEEHALEWVGPSIGRTSIYPTKLARYMENSVSGYVQACSDKPKLYDSVGCKCLSVCACVCVGRLKYPVCSFFFLILFFPTRPLQNRGEPGDPITFYRQGLPTLRREPPSILDRQGVDVTPEGVGSSEEPRGLQLVSC